MAINTPRLVNYCDKLLSAKGLKDYCPNGLQVAGGEQIKSIVSGVTACQELITQAINYQADLILVHHGYFWRGEDPRIIGMHKERIYALLKNNINLLAYHLPLDVHPQYGNNALLAQQLGFKITGELTTKNKLGNIGSLNPAMKPEQLKQHIKQVLGREPLLINADRTISKIAWCSGAAQDFIYDAINSQADAYISGEISERTVHIARENNISYFAIGHHASERYGVKALGQHLARKFDLKHQFIDIANPV